MGILTDFIANQNVYDNGNNSAGVHRSVKRYFDNLVEMQTDPAYPADLAAIDEVQSLAVHVATVSGGTFALTVKIKGTTDIKTAGIAYNANAATIESAIDTAVAAVDEVQTIPQFTAVVSGGTFTLTLNLAGINAIETANIAFDANAATIESAIDTAVTAAGVTGWTNGDITVAVTTTLVAGDGTLTYDGASVDDQAQGLATIDGTLLTGGGSANTIVRTNIGHAPVSGWSSGDISVALTGDLTTNPATFTYDGTSVAGANHGAMVVDDALLTGGGSAGAVTTTTAGQTTRPALAVLRSMNVVSTVPDQGSTSGLVVVGVSGSMYLNPNADVLRALALQAAIDDSADALETAILDGLRANGVEV